MAYNHFDYVPSTIDRKRSVFKYDKACASSAFIGFLYPICKPERMMPGSTLSLNIAAEVRSGALIAPLMDELYMDVFSFFVPNRIVWEHWKQFIGAVDDVLFNNLTQYKIPSFKFGNARNFASGQETFQWNQLIACHFGLPYPGTSTSTLSYCPTISALPFRGYTFIWNEFFRPEQIESPEVINRTDSGWVGMNMDFNPMWSHTIGGVSVNIPIPASNTGATQTNPISGGVCLFTYRAHRSLWTSCLPNPSLETLNLLANLQAPVGVFSNASGTTTSNSNPVIFNGTAVLDGQFVPNKQALNGVANSLDLVTDLSQALLTVNNYRETIMLQNYYDVLNRAGSRYDEIMYNIFGTRASNSAIDIPELITHKRFTIYRKEVVAMANSSDPDNNVEPIGNQASYIDTVIKDNFFTRSVTEHGYIHMLYTIRPSRIRRVQGIEPEWRQLDKMDLYYPQFDGMGDVARYKCELWWDFSSSEASQIVTGTEFGYQEYGADWKYQRNDATGFLDRNTTTSVPGFTLQEDLTAAPSLIGTYISCLAECTAFSSCLALPNPTLAPQFVLDIRLTGTITHPMPVYNIPGAGALL